jgi:enoyl-CoA hydratase
VTAVETTTRVAVTVEGGAAWITLDGAPTRNALDRESAAALVAACEAVDADASVGVAVISGANGTFCSGAVRASWRGLGASRRTSAMRGWARCIGRSIGSGA